MKKITSAYSTLPIGVGGKEVKKVDMLKSNWLPVFLMCFYVGIHEKSKSLNFFPNWWFAAGKTYDKSDKNDEKTENMSLTANFDICYVILFTIWCWLQRVKRKISKLGFQ